MEKLAKSNAINLGLYLGATLSIFIVLAYAVNLDLFLNPMFGSLLLLIPIIFGIISIIKAKKLSSSLLNFKYCFTAFFISILIGLTIYLLFNYVLFNFVDLEAGETIQEKLIEFQAEGMQRSGRDEDAISEFIEQRESQYQYSLSNTIFGLATYLVVYSIIGLIAAAFMKKNPENEY